MAENFLNLKKKTDIQFQEVQKVPNKMNPKRSLPRYIIIKMANIQDERILKGSDTLRVFSKWWKSKSGRSPSSPQIHQKLICI